MNGERRYPRLTLMAAPLMEPVSLLGQDLHYLVPISRWVQVINTTFNLPQDLSHRRFRQVGPLFGGHSLLLLNRQQQVQRRRLEYESFTCSIPFCKRFALKIAKSRL